MGEAAEGLLDVGCRLRLNRLGRLGRLNRLRRNRLRVGGLRLKGYRSRRQRCVLSRG